MTQISIIIPLHRDSERFRLTLCKILDVASTLSSEVIVVSDRKPLVEMPSSVVLVLTDSAVDTPPGVKRDAAMSIATGEYLAFIDDDAYPSDDWLSNSLKILRDSRVAGVGGPGLTPRDSNIWERLGGAIYESRLGSGPLRHRFVSTGVRRDILELPAFNLVLRFSTLHEAGRWESQYYGGEDTKVCEALIKQGKRLVYDPDVVVFHYRRPMFRAHMRQIANVGRHRGYFVKKYPRTSRRPLYFVPLVAMAFFVATVIIGMMIAPFEMLLLLLVLWLLLTVMKIPKFGTFSILFPLCLFAHHISYGISFLQGLLTRQLDI